MHKREDLTEADLKALLLARLHADEDKKAKLRERLGLKLGEVKGEEDRIVAASKDRIIDWLSGTLARRLKQDCRTVPLLSPQDYTTFVPLVIDSLEQAQAAELEGVERKVIKEYVEVMFKNINEYIQAATPPHTDPYDEYWQWVTAALDLAAERGIPATDLLALEGSSDELMRRVYTKEQFVDHSGRSLYKFMDADVLKRMMIRPILSMVATDADEEELQELERDVEELVMPQLRAFLEKTKAFFNAWIAEETTRIYGVG